MRCVPLLSSSCQRNASGCELSLLSFSWNPSEGEGSKLDTMWHTHHARQSSENPCGGEGSLHGNALEIHVGRKWAVSHTLYVII